MKNLGLALAVSAASLFVAGCATQGDGCCPAPCCPAPCACPAPCPCPCPCASCKGCSHCKQVRCHAKCNACNIDDRG